MDEQHTALLPEAGDRPAQAVRRDEHPVAHGRGHQVAQVRGQKNTRLGPDLNRCLTEPRPQLLARYDVLGAGLLVPLGPQLLEKVEHAAKHGPIVLPSTRDPRDSGHYSGCSNTRWKPTSALPLQPLAHYLWLFELQRRGSEP